ncbi:class I SAM-dependent methyltransferase [Comamonas sp. J-3]|jgi:SAM-dependent methyltransferase|uniref:class I SAM-dependent methyltransferase n=1 Tax=Comamonas trifloxystrobinivorans TaxID=3350256 RepID=UPI00372C0556
MNEQIIGTQNWWNMPLGRYMLAWEQTCYDEAVVDIFGFHSLQIGLFPLKGLQSNRMPHRWLALESSEQWQQWQSSLDTDVNSFAQALQSADAAAQQQDQAPAAAVQTAALLCSGSALPFANNSLDLVLLPHALELSADPHAVLREVARVLVPEGRVLISGVNPVSLWGMHTWSRRIPGRQKVPPMPDDRNLIGYGRLRDWLKLLDLELETASFGCYRPALRSDQWLGRWDWLDQIGPTAWPIFGGVYFVEAVKKVAGVHMLAAPWRAVATAPAVRPVAVKEGVVEKERVG